MKLAVCFVSISCVMSPAIASADCSLAQQPEYQPAEFIHDCLRALGMSNPLAPEEATITVTNTPATVGVILTNSPATRARVSFDDEDGTRHLELEWDPAVDSPLFAG